MPTVSEQLQALERTRRAEAEARYRVAVRAAAEGRPVDLGAVADTLRELGRNAARFADDTRFAAYRIELRAKLATVPRIKQEMADCQAERARREAEFKPVYEAHIQACRQLDFRNDKLLKELIAAERCQRELVESCSAPETVQQHNWLRVALDEAGRHQTRLRQLVSDRRAELDSRESRAAGERAGMYAEEVEGARRALETAQRDLAAADAERDRVEAALAAYVEAIRAA